MRKIIRLKKKQGKQKKFEEIVVNEEIFTDTIIINQKLIKELGLNGKTEYTDWIIVWGMIKSKSCDYDQVMKYISMADISLGTYHVRIKYLVDINVLYHTDVKNVFPRTYSQNCVTNV